jgi:hypothetical protein
MYINKKEKKEEREEREREREILRKGNTNRHNIQ